ncbi:unnamed protein product [Arctogadus glacialis]
MLDPNTKDNIVQWKEWVSKSTPYSKKGQNGSTVETEVKTTSLEKSSASIEKLEHSSVKIFEVKEEEILKSAGLVPPTLKPVPGTMTVHQLIAKKAGCIRVREVSCFCKNWCDCNTPKDFTFSCNNSEAENEGGAEGKSIEVGTWVLVNYDGDLFPGIVTQAVAEQYEVDTMYRAGTNRFFIPGVEIPGDKVCAGLECCPSCPPGWHVVKDCTERRITKCSRCPNGTFQAGFNEQKQCSTCTKCDAGLGLKVKRPCTPTSDAVCETLDGSFCSDSNGGGCMAAQSHRLSCSPGHCIGQRGTAVKDTECLHCTDGTFSEGTQSSCKNHTKCDSGVQIQPGTDSTDSTCIKYVAIVFIIIGCISLIILVLGACVYRRRNMEKEMQGWWFHGLETSIPPAPSSETQPAGLETSIPPAPSSETQPAEVTTPLRSTDGPEPTGDQQECTITIPDGTIVDHHGVQSLGPARPSSSTHNGSESVSVHQEDHQPVLTKRDSGASWSSLLSLGLPSRSSLLSLGLPSTSRSTPLSLGPRSTPLSLGPPSISRSTPLSLGLPSTSRSTPLSLGLPSTSRSTPLSLGPRSTPLSLGPPSTSRSSLLRLGPPSTSQSARRFRFRSKSESSCLENPKLPTDRVSLLMDGCCR